MRTLILVLALLAAAGGALAETPPPLTIEQLLSHGWEIAGYTTAADNRASLILFKHAGENVLVQCSIHYEVTRQPLAVVNCYELH